MQIVQEIYVYDKSGVYLKSYHNGTKKEIGQQENQKVYLSSEYLGENAIIKNNELRAMTREEKILSQTEELKKGEYIKNNKVISAEKPNNFHFWDLKKNEWVYDIELEEKALNDEILSLEIELLPKYGEYEKAAERKLKTLEKQLKTDIEDLNYKINEKYKRLEELE